MSTKKLLIGLKRLEVAKKTDPHDVNKMIWEVFGGLIVCLVLLLVGEEIREDYYLRAGWCEEHNGTWEDISGQCGIAQCLKCVNMTNAIYSNEKQHN
jgi:hypothetical protein